MSLTFIKELGSDHILGCWTIHEDLAELQNNLLEADKSHYHRQGQWSERRKKEWLATRMLLRNMLPSSPQILYDRTGKPGLSQNEYNISISHSSLMVALVLCKNKAVGVDIQEIRNSVIPGRDFFCNEAEQQWLDPHDRLQLNLVWSAKEAVYKCYGNARLIFRDQIEICPFSMEQSGQLSAYIYDSGDRHCLPITYEILSSYVLTYTHSLIPST
ncbi:4'-phosphopantetheinyl transferase family protein [Dyadobacter tibetensis]|uniref:4'-phosphopantetheinyl transferase family protein n=1 Tax=Dyadobacter tibetensis TaxID=1211851 RepID=UPI0004711969|nr:4'-phosphopantetheinyl transferase superfamily protein [Dyadobacter tibetensis]